jgi:hypothetical protein
MKIAVSKTLGQIKGGPKPSIHMDVWLGQDMGMGGQMYDRASVERMVGKGGDPYSGAAPLLSPCNTKIDD